MPDSDKVFVKFGITHHWDVMDRFNPKVDDGYTKNYSDWKIVCKFSKPCSTKEQAEALEKKWLTEVFPNPGPTKVWVENYLKISDNLLEERTKKRNKDYLDTKKMQIQLEEEVHKSGIPYVELDMN